MKKFYIIVWIEIFSVILTISSMALVFITNGMLYFITMWIGVMGAWLCVILIGINER